MEEFLDSEDEKTTIKFIRLATGEDLVAELTEFKSIDEHFYVLNNPMKIVYTSGLQPGMIGVMLMHWVFPRICDSTEFVVYSQDIVTLGEASRDMESYYFTQLDKMANVKIAVGTKNIMERTPEKGKPSLDDYPDMEYGDDIEDDEFSDEELDYVKGMISDIRNNKRRLH